MSPMPNWCIDFLGAKLLFFLDKKVYTSFGVQITFSINFDMIPREFGLACWARDGDGQPPGPPPPLHPKSFPFGPHETATCHTQWHAHMAEMEPSLPNMSHHNNTQDTTPNIVRVTLTHMYMYMYICTRMLYPPAYIWAMFISQINQVV